MEVTRLAHSVNSDPYLNGRYRRHSGHCSALAGDGSVANDPCRTFPTVICRIAKGLLDHLVGADLDRRRQLDANCFGGLEVGD
jgi:hypothetical protein